MPPTRTLVLLASDPARAATDATPPALQRRSQLVPKLLALGEHVHAFANAGGTDLKVLPDRAAVDAALADTGCDTVVVVEPTQLFLDLPLARAGLARFDPAYHDSFTQWEHCRLPVGVGVRALAARTWLALDADTPHAAFAELRHHPAGRKFAYDVERRVPFADSLLDARYGPALAAVLDQLGSDQVGDAWTLERFLRLAAPHAASLRYAPTELADRMDERRMPAPYGFESERCAAFPTYVMFDVTNLCNARCVHCPQSLRDDDGAVPAFLRAKEHQSLETFKRVIDECAEHGVDFVRVTADGEPLVHPDLFAMLAYARGRGVGPVGLTTNGSLLHGDRAERLLDSGVAMVDFSLDAARPDTFHRIRVGLSFERTIANVERFLALRAQRGSDVRVIVSFVKQAENVDEVEEFRTHWEPLVDEVIVREMISNVGLNDATESLWPGWDARWPCAHFFRRVVINHQGLLKACPIDWEQRTVNLPVEAASLHEQWHGDFYWKHRMQHLNDRIETSSACHGCRDWSGTPWELGYEKIVSRLVVTG